MLVKFDELTEEQKDVFCMAFYDASPCTEQEQREDCECAVPWGCPWYNGETEIELEGTTPEEWGQVYYKMCEKDFLETLYEGRKEQAESESIELSPKVTFIKVKA